jgi:hypothetical protein
MVFQPEKQTQNLIIKNPSQKRAGGVARGVAPEFKALVPKKKKKRKKHK